jgi:hypothetical protein
MFAQAAEQIHAHEPFTVDILYGDSEGGQRVITRFALFPGRDETWLAAVSHHWNLDRSDPR